MHRSAARNSEEPELLTDLPQLSARKLLQPFKNLELRSVTPKRVRQDKLAKDRRCKSFTG